MDNIELKNMDTKALIELMSILKGMDDALKEEDGETDE